jgi:hypothetical protein
VKAKYVVLVVVALALIGLVVACAGPNDLRNIPTDSGFVAGFWNGLWDGFTLPVAFIWSLFDNQVGLYQAHNDGHLYDLGFVIGAYFIFAVVLASRSAGRGNISARSQSR